MIADYEVEIAYDGHNREVFGDIFSHKSIGPNKFEREKLTQVASRKNDTIEWAIDATVEYLNSKHNANIQEYHRDQAGFVPMYHRVPKNPLFEVEEYETDKFRVINNLSDENLEVADKVKNSRKLEHQYEILPYGIQKAAFPFKHDHFWGPIFRMIRIAPKLIVRQELNIINFDTTEGELTLQNFLKKCVVEINSYHFGFIESYDLTKHLKEPIIIIEDDEPVLEYLDYGSFVVTRPLYK